MTGDQWLPAGGDAAAAVAALLERAQAQARDATTNEKLFQARRRLDEPLRLAIAGKVKAGKSTLLNALLGEPLAATDASECTKIVTWYRHGPTPAAEVILRDGTVRPASWTRTGGPLSINLDPHPADLVDHINVTWPARALQELTIIDTPGVASISDEVSARTHAALSTESDHVPVADAVIYLMRHTHPGDIRFLEAFHDDEIAHGTPINAVGVLSRADEIGLCRPDAMTVAQTIADRYTRHPRLHRLCPIVVPVDALLGNAPIMLDRVDYELLRTIAALPSSECDQLLLTVDRFTTRPTSTRIRPADRTRLLQQLGLFGVRLAVHLLSTGEADTDQTLQGALVRGSGLRRLQQLLSIQFQQRSRLLRARTALNTLAEILRSDGCIGTSALQASLERLIATDHELEELRLLTDLHAGVTELKPDQSTELERIIGGNGSDARTRLGLPTDTDAGTTHREALTTLTRWRALSGHPMSNQATRRTAEIAIRTLEGILLDDERAVNPAGPEIRGLPERTTPVRVGTDVGEA